MGCFKVDFCYNSRLTSVCDIEDGFSANYYINPTRMERNSSICTYHFYTKTPLTSKTVVIKTLLSDHQVKFHGLSVINTVSSSIECNYFKDTSEEPSNALKDPLFID